MTDAFQTLIDHYQARMALLSATLARDGYLLGVSRRDPSYSILLTRNSSPDSSLRVTSFRDRQPVGHREYDMLAGGSPIQNALAEFMGEDIVLATARSAVRRAAAPPTCGLAAP